VLKSLSRLFTHASSNQFESDGRELSTAIGVNIEIQATDDSLTGDWWGGQWSDIVCVTVWRATLDDVPRALSGAASQMRKRGKAAMHNAAFYAQKWINVQK